MIAIRIGAGMDDQWWLDSIKDVEWELALFDELQEFALDTAGLELTRHVLACPEAFEGLFDGHQFLFRERHCRWRLEIDGKVVEEGDEAMLPGGLGLDHFRFVVALLRDRLSYKG